MRYLASTVAACMWRSLNQSVLKSQHFKTEQHESCFLEDAEEPLLDYNPTKHSIFLLVNIWYQNYDKTLGLADVTAITYTTALLAI